MADLVVTTAIRAMQAAQDPLRGNIEQVLRGDAPEPLPDAELRAIGVRLDAAVDAYVAFLPTFEAAQAAAQAAQSAACARREGLEGDAWMNVMREVCEPFTPDMDHGEYLTLAVDRLSEQAIALRPTTVEGAAVIAQAVRFWFLESFSKPREKLDWNEQLIVALVTAVQTLAGQDVRVAQQSASAALPSGLEQACRWAVRHKVLIDATAGPEDWSDERLDAEIDRYNAVIDRALVEPSRSFGDLQAKGSLAQREFEDRLCPFTDQARNAAREAKLDNGQRLLRIVLRELATQAGEA